MKKRWLIPVMLCLSLWACKTAPPAEPEPPPAFPVQEMDYNGLRILFVHSPKEVVSMQLFLKGGSGNYRKGREGVDWLALNTAIRGGSEHLDSLAMQKQLDEWGAKLSAGSTPTYGNISLTCFREDFRDAFDLFMDVLDAPAFPESTFEGLKAQKIKRLEQAENDPWTLLDQRSREWAFAETHLEKHPGGSKKALEQISLREARGYYKTMVAKDRLVLVVVGRVNQDIIWDKLLDAFRAIPEQGFSGDTTALEPVALHDLKVVENPGFTQYVQGVFPGPEPGSEEAMALEVALAVLDLRLREELAEKKGLTPDPRVALHEGPQTWATIRFSCNDPNKVASIALEEVLSLHQNGFDSLEVQRASTALRLLWTLDSQGAERIADRVGQAEVTTGYRKGLQKPFLLEKMDTESVNAAFRKYCRNIHWTCLGNPSLPRPASFRLNLDE